MLRIQGQLMSAVGRTRVETELLPEWMSLVMEEMFGQPPNLVKSNHSLGFFGRPGFLFPKDLFKYAFNTDFKSNFFKIVSKAVDSACNSQPDDPRPLWNFRGYMNNSMSRVNILSTVLPKDHSDAL